MTTRKPLRAGLRLPQSSAGRVAVSRLPSLGGLPGRQGQARAAVLRTQLPGDGAAGLCAPLLQGRSSGHGSVPAALHPARGCLPPGSACPLGLSSPPAQSPPQLTEGLPGRVP